MIRLRHGSARESAHAFFDLCREHVKQNGMDPDKTFFVFPFGGFGDFTFICSLLPLLRQEGPVALFLPDHRMDFFELFPQAADFVVRYAPHFVQFLPELFHQGMRKPGYPFVPFTDWFADGRFNMELVCREGRLTLKESYAYALGLPLTSAGIEALVPEVPLPEALLAQARRVLVIPHANSHKPFQPEMWQILTDQLNAEGYQVFFESTSYPGAIPLNAQLLQMSVKELIGSMGAFDAVVALRSGLTDLMGSVPSTQRGKLAVVYHVTAEPPAEEQRFNHARGVSTSGLALARIYPGNDSIRDFEVDGDTLDQGEISQITDFAVKGKAKRSLRRAK
jgi:hypothetical protein